MSESTENPTSAVTTAKTPGADRLAGGPAALPRPRPSDSAHAATPTPPAVGAPRAADTPPAADAPAVAGAAPAPALPIERRVRFNRTSAEGSATFIGAAGASLGLVWVIYERVLPFSGVLGFWLAWYVVFLALYWVMARMQWDRLEARNRLAAVAFGTGGVLVVLIVIEQVAYTLARGANAVPHPNFWTKSLAFAGPDSPMTVGGVLHAIVGSLEQLALATIVSVPLGVTAALFLSEIGGALARTVRTIVEAMTALPDLVAGLFIYVTLILSLGVEKSGVCAAIAIGVTMMPIVARASEVVLRIVPGALREASYALGSSHWRTVWNVVLPTARSGLATAIVLAMARGIGETAPVLLVAGYTKELNANPFSGPQTSLPLFIYNAVHVLGTNSYVQRGFGAGFVLVVVVLALFTIARRIGGSAPGELTKRQRRRLAREAAEA
jgi:phosphate transport system permease protein